MPPSLTPEDLAVLERDYSRSQVLRLDADRFTTVKRGSVRLVRDLYRTESEFESFLAEGLRVALPRPDASREKKQRAV